MMGSRQAGFTMVEVLVAAFVVAIVAVALLGLITLGVRTSLLSERRTVAQGIANEELERMRLFAYEDVGYVSGTPSGILPPIRTVERNGQQYEVVYDIDEVDDALTARPVDYKRVVVTVTGQDAGRLPPVTASTLIVSEIGAGGSCDGFFWSFDEGSGTNFNDNGGCNAGTISGTDTQQIWDNTPENTRLQFPNPAAFFFSGLSTPYYAKFDPITLYGQDAWTISFWFNKPSGAAVNSFYLFGGPDQIEDGRIEFGGSTFSALSVYFGPSNQVVSTGGLLWETDTWYHVALVNTGENILHIYIDGSDEGGVGGPGDLSYLRLDRIGQSGGDDEGLRWGGWIDDVRIYERVLTAQEVQQLSNGEDVQ